MKGVLYKIATIISVSITAEHKVFLDEMGLSPSELLQRSINDLIESSKVSRKQVDELNRRIGVLQGTLDKQREFIETNGLMDKFLGI